MTNETRVLESDVERMVEIAPMFAKLATHEQAQQAAEYLRKIREIRKKIAAFFKPDISAAHKLHASLIGKMNMIDEQPAKLEETYKGLLAEWHEHTLSIQKAQQESLDATARRSAQAQAILDDDQQRAKDIASGAIPVASKAIAQPAERISGIVARQLWIAKIEDKLALVKAIAAGEYPLDWVEINISAIEQTIRSTNGAINIPGITSTQTTSIAARRTA